MMRCICSVCKKQCKTLSCFCSPKCEVYFNKKFAKMIQWDIDNPNPTWKQCDERQKIVAECEGRS